MTTTGVPAANAQRWQIELVLEGLKAHT